MIIDSFEVIILLNQPQQQFIHRLVSRIMCNPITHLITYYQFILPDLLVDSVQFPIPRDALSPYPLTSEAIVSLLRTLLIEVIMIDRCPFLLFL